MKRKTILIVDDDPIILKLLRTALEKNNYLVFESQTGEDALSLLNIHSIDAIILDIMLPGIDGLETLTLIRKSLQYENIPIIMLTSKNSELDSVVGLEMGADDYIGKPIRYRELLARLKAVFRRTNLINQTNSEKIVLGNLIIDSTTRMVLKDGQPLKLTYKEFELLLLLAKNPGKVFSRSELLERIWQDQLYTETRTVDVHIRRLRKKIFNNTSSYIESVRSVGYCLHIK